MSTQEYIVIYTTYPDEKCAKMIVQGLVEQKLAACGNLFKISSIYQWKSKIEQADEFGVFIKTRKHLYDKVETYIKEHHPYEVPEIISWPIERGLPSYLDWIGKETT
ncbi:MAG: divalent-cation tolerance protein CutA [candidate division WOR-3 bacterium]|nr:MAG: divalent-cation tolerance protein CutA [candidate division WOR-3 bacterium]